MRILITGLNGFIGQYLEQRLKGNHALFDLECDLRDHEAVSKRLNQVDPDLIIHLAARTEVEKSFYEQTTFSDINYTGTVNLIECARHLPNLKLFLFASTMETYGWQPQSDSIEEGRVHYEEKLAVFDEDTVQHPNAPYAVAKMACEKYLEYAGRSYDFPYCALRQTNTYGRTDNDFFVVEQIITQMLTNPDEISLGYKAPYRNFLFIDDLIDLYVAIVDAPEKANKRIFCTGPANAVSINNLANRIALKLDWEGTIKWDTKPKRDGEIYILNSSNKLATEVLGWEPKVNLSDGLDTTINIWKDKLS